MYTKRVWLCRLASGVGPWLGGVARWAGRLAVSGGAVPGLGRRTGVGWADCSRGERVELAEHIRGAVFVYLGIRDQTSRTC